MNALRIELEAGRTRYRPGDPVAGTAQWELADPPKAVEVRLFWYTQGKGTVDVGVVDSVRFEAPGPRDRRDFRFALPRSPYSFSGKLVSLLWAVEVVADPSSEAGRAEITMSPTGEEIRLQREGP